MCRRHPIVIEGRQPRDTEVDAPQVVGIARTARAAIDVCCAVAVAVAVCRAVTVQLFLPDHECAGEIASLFQLGSLGLDRILAAGRERHGVLELERARLADDGRARVDLADDPGQRGPDVAGGVGNGKRQGVSTVGKVRVECPASRSVGRYGSEYSTAFCYRDG